MSDALVFAQRDVIDGQHGVIRDADENPARVEVYVSEQEFSTDEWASRQDPIMMEVFTVDGYMMLCMDDTAATALRDALTQIIATRQAI